MRFPILATILAVAFAAPAAKNALSGDVNRLKDLANVEIKKLESEGKHLLAKELLAVEDKLEHLNPNNELGRIGVHALESVVKSIEHQLETELKKLSGGSYYANTKNELQGDVQRLKKLADVEIKKLESEGKGLLAQEIKVLEKELLSAEAKLEHLNPHDELGQIGVHALQLVVKSIEHKLEDELKKLGGAYYANPKNELQGDVQRLKKLADVEIKKLESEGKGVLAQEIKVLEKELLSAEAKLEHLNPHDELGQIGVHALQSVVKSIEHKLEAELKKLGGGAFYDNTKDDLNADINRLKKLADSEIKKLESEGKSLLEKELRVLETEIVSVEKQLLSVNPNNEVGKIAVSSLKTVLKGLENQLEAEIKKLGGK